jgi:hypothetical protein
MIVGDGVEFRDDRADQAPRQLRLTLNLLGSGTATKQQQPQHSCGGDLESLAPCRVSLDYLLPCPSLIFESVKSRGPCPVCVAPYVRQAGATDAASGALALHPVLQNRAGRAPAPELGRT